jgi:hypothetical protein
VPASVIFVDAESGRGPRLHRHDYTELFFVLGGRGDLQGWGMSVS